ncbi:hypothetical protein D9758_019054 [Tetrapyrgos nigripes]|uniref:Uncharacterized protein n=1 Tax=Tetrapyrgos nigripes TaxID=182062 RepID=A0A8H5AQZ3_9AGAR|nr:hypothetical protein D9758_019054 [Tetrapyrgos nigripes]
MDKSARVKVALITGAEEIKRVAGAKECSLHFADVSSEEQVQKMIADVVETYGGLDIMVANAGIVPTYLSWRRRSNFGTKSLLSMFGVPFCYKYAGIQWSSKGKEAESLERVVLPGSPESAIFLVHTPGRIRYTWNNAGRSGRVRKA